MKYPLTNEAKEAASYLTQAWETKLVNQFFTVSDLHSTNKQKVEISVMSGRLSPNFVCPPINVLLELSRFQLVHIDTRFVQGSADSLSRTYWNILLMQELRNAVESDFEVSDYFLTINAVGTIIQAGATVLAPFQSAAVGYGSLSQTQTAENSQLAEKLIQMLGKQFLESNGEIVKAINEFRESTESERQSKLGNVISQLGNSLQHGANTIVVSQALMYLAPFISQIIN